MDTIHRENTSCNSSYTLIELASCHKKPIHAIIAKAYF